MNQGAMPAYPEWRPIESAPKDGTDVLIWNGEVTIAYFEGSKEWPQSPERFDSATLGQSMLAQPGRTGRRRPALVATTPPAWHVREGFKVQPSIARQQVSSPAASATTRCSGDTGRLSHEAWLDRHPRRARTYGPIILSGQASADNLRQHQRPRLRPGFCYLVLDDRRRLSIPHF